MKRFISAILAAVCMLLMLPSAAYALDLEPSVLTVATKYDGTALSGINIAVHRVAKLAEVNDALVYSAEPAFSTIENNFAALAEALAANKSVALDPIVEACNTCNSIAVASKSTGSDGKAEFSGLTAGLYLVMQTNDANSQYLIAPFLVAVPNPGMSGLWNYSVIACPKTQPVRANGENISVRVYKLWKGTDAPPGFIWVQLYRNGNAHGDPVSLNADNFWSYTWNKLDSREIWTVDEPSVPDGYIKSISGNVDSGFIITNTRKYDGTTPSYPYEPSKGSNNSNGKGPKTDDGSNMQLWITLILTSSVGLLAVLCLLVRSQKKRTAV